MDVFMMWGTGWRPAFFDVRPAAGRGFMPVAGTGFKGIRHKSEVKIL